MKLNSNWSKAKKYWWSQHAMRDSKNNEAWKTYMREKYTANLAKLDE